MPDGYDIALLTVQAQMDGTAYARGAQQVVDSNRAIAQSDREAAAAEQELNRATVDTARTMTERASRAASIRARYDEQFRATEQLAREERTLQRAYDAGRISLEEYTQTLNLVRAAHQQMIAGINARPLQNLARGIGEAVEAARQQAVTGMRTLGAEIAAAARTAQAQSDAAWRNSFAGVSQAAQGIQRLAEAYDPLLAVERRHAQAVSEINALHAAGVYTDRQRADALGRVQAGYQQQVAAVRASSAAGTEHARTLGLQSHQLANLSFQLNDVVTGLISGQAPMMIMAQQGGQIVQVFGGVGRVFGALLSPIGLATAAVLALTGGFAAGIARAGELEHQAKALAVTLSAYGNRGLSGLDAQQAALGFARSPGVSRDAAQQATTELLRNPLISGDVFREALPLARDFAAVTGQEIPAAAKQLASALTGGYQAAQQLDQSFRFLSVGELNQIRLLELQGRASEAASLLTQKLAEHLRGMADRSVTPLQAATANLGNAWDDFLDRLSRTGPITLARDALIGMLDAVAQDAKKVEATLPPVLVLQAQLNKLIKDRLELQKNLDLPAPGQAAELARVQSQIVFVQAQIAASRMNVGGIADPMLDAAPALAQMEAQAQAAKKVGEAAKLAGTDLDGMAKSIDELGRSLDPAQEQSEKLAASQQKILTLMANGRGDIEKLIELYVRLGVEAGKLQTIDNRTRRDNEDIGIAGLYGAARARAEAMRTFREEFPLAPEGEVLAAGNRAGRRFGANAASGVAQQVDVLRQQAEGLERVARAYAQNQVFGREAELQLQAEVQARDAGADAARNLAAALIEEERARRLVEAVQLIRSTNVEVELQKKLTEGLRVGAQAYSDAQIEVQVLRAEEAGLFRDLTNGADQYRAALKGLRDEELKRQAIQANRQYDPAAAYQDAIDKIEQLKRTGELSVRAEVEMRREAYIRQAAAGNDWLAGAKAGLLEYQRTAEQTGGAVANALVRGLEQTEEIIARLALGMETNIRQAIRGIAFEIVRLAVRQNVTGPIAGVVAQAFGGVSSGTAPGASGTPASQGGAVGFNPLSFFGSNGPGAFLGQPMWGPSAAAYEGVIPGMSGADAARYFGQLNGTPTWGQGLMAGAGILAGGYQALQGGRQNLIGGVGTMVGSAVSLIPGWGQIAGPLIAIGSQILGGLLADKPATPQATTDIAIENGVAVLGGNTSRGSGNVNGTTQAGQSVVDQLNRTVWGLGLRFGAGAEGGYALNSRGNNTGDQWIYGTGSYANGTAVETANGLSGEAVVAGLLGTIIQRAAANGQLEETGRLAVSQTLLTVLAAAGEQTQEELKTRIETAKAYDDAILGQGAGQSVTRSIRDLKEQFNALAYEAQRLGLALGPLDQALAEQTRKLWTDFTRGIGDELLGRTDPAALARAQADRWRDDRLAEVESFLAAGVASAEEAQAEITQIYATYAQMQKDIVRQYFGAIQTSLENLVKELTIGTLSGASPRTILDATAATYTATAAQAMAGDREAQARFEADARAYLTAAQAFYANDPRYAAILETVKSQTLLLQALIDGAAADILPAAANDATGTITATVPAGSTQAANDGSGLATSSTGSTATTATQAAIDALVAKIADLTTKLEALTVALGTESATRAALEEQLAAVTAQLGRYLSAQQPTFRKAG